jgi:hypothetical protein
VALKPDAPNPYDTLAEVHHMRKERALALEVVDQGESLMSGPGARVFLHNRPRFEKGDGLSSSVVDRRQTAAIYLPALRPEGASATAPNPAQQAFLQVADQVRTRVKEACWADSQGFKGSLIARLELAPKGGPPTKVELVTAAAAPLAACIQRTLGETSFPVPPPPVRGTFTLPINF